MATGNKPLGPPWVPLAPEAVRAGAKMSFPAQLSSASLRASPSASAGVSSFGFSGTIAHTVMRGTKLPAAPCALVATAAAAASSALGFRSRRFAWRAMSSALLGIPHGHTEEGFLFLAAVEYPFVSIVADHVVQKHNVFQK